MIIIYTIKIMLQIAFLIIFIICLLTYFIKNDIYKDCERKEIVWLFPVRLKRC